MQISTGGIIVAVSWNELPAYGARVLRAGIQKFGQPVTIVATMPKVPIRGMKEILNQEIYWIDRSGIKSWKDLEMPIPDIFFQAGTYYVPSFRSLGKEVRRRGGKVVLLSDNCWKKSLRQIVGSVLFRMVFKNWFSAVWVPGKSGVKLMRIYGFPINRIYDGLYGSDDNCFIPGKPLKERPKQFLFVGQLIYLKGLDTLIEAFNKFSVNNPDWKMVIYGEGEYEQKLISCDNLILHPFAQAEVIAKAMRESRFLVLPTLSDHWPLVVNEASLSGCGLILSNVAGNSLEFLNEKNGFSYAIKSVDQLYDCLCKAATLPGDRLDEVYEESLRLGSYFTPKQSGERFCQIISDLKELN